VEFHDAPPSANIPPRPPAITDFADVN